VKRLKLAPATILSAYGDRVAVDSTQTNERTEQVGRAVAVECGGWGVMVTCATTGAQIRDAFVPGTITKALKVGKAIARARAEGRDPVPPCIEAAGGIKMFEGRVTSYDRHERGGFMYGEIMIQGLGPDEGKVCRIFQKTEYELAWVDSKVAATSPDSICVIDRKTADGLTSFPDLDVGPYRHVREVDFRPGREVVVFGIKAHKIWRTKRGVELFGPKHFGFDVPYVPIDSRAKPA
jgi:DUF917 family protein